MHDIIKLGYIGLEEREIRVLKSIFMLSPELKQHYALVDINKISDAGLVLVNADSDNAIQEWDNLSRTNKLVNPMALSREGKTIDKAGSLKLPIRLPSLIEALEKAVKGRNIDDGVVDETTLKVLIVDDSFPVRKYMEQKLSDLIDFPVQLSLAESGEEALLKCKARSYDLVFLDVVMTGIDGYKVCKSIKSNSTSYVVMLTSKKSPFDKVRGTMSGCDAYITKPPEDIRLKDEIDKSRQYKAVQK
ncbi:MAG: response regulator [Gammaproteobacteria bacterium]|nr:response regulator [Gammaproteobacteria bacterium]